MQKKTKLIKQIIASGLLVLALAPQGSQIAQAQELSTFLLRLKCVDAGIGNWARRRENVVVGKAVYTSQLYMGPGDRFASLTCRLQPNEANVIFQRLQLGFGMRDNDRGSPDVVVNGMRDNDRGSPDVVVNVYLDGILAASQAVSPGQLASVSFDVTTTSNVSVEAVCLSNVRYCDRVYFWEASVGIAP